MFFFFVRARARVYVSDANANEADKVSDQLQSTSIAVGTASSGNSIFEYFIVIRFIDTRTHN